MRHTFWLAIASTYILFWLLFTPHLATHDPRAAFSGTELAAPSAEHLLGNDRLGRDVWSRLAVGGHITLRNALLATTVSIGGGLVLAVLNSFTGIKIATEILTDALLAFPGVLLALLIRTGLGNAWYALALAVGLSNLAAYARTATDAFRVAAAAPHIEGAMSIGASRWRIVLYHQLPTALPTLTAFGAVIFAWSILYAAALSFLGLGESPSTPEWGVILAQGQGVMVQAPQLVLLPGLLIALSIWIAYRVANAVTAQS